MMTAPDTATAKDKTIVQNSRHVALPYPDASVPKKGERFGSVCRPDFPSRQTEVKKSADHRPDARS